MSDSEGEVFKTQDFKEVTEEIERSKKDPKTSGMFVSGWDDADRDIEVVQDPTANPVDHVLWAAEYGELKTLKQLISNQPILVHAKDSDGYTPIHRASYGNHVRTISFLLSVGAEVTAKTEMGWTPLHSACNWNNYACVARLLGAGADPGALSAGGQTPIHLAAALSHCKSTLLILFLRDDVVEISRRPNNSGETPEDLARGHGIFAPLFEMVLPSASHIRTLAFTCNPYVRSE